jgi:hypothetical protein
MEENILKMPALIAIGKVRVFGLEDRQTDRQRLNKQQLSHLQIKPSIKLIRSVASRTVGK